MPTFKIGEHEIYISTFDMLFRTRKERQKMIQAQKERIAAKLKAAKEAEEKAAKEAEEKAKADAAAAAAAPAPEAAPAPAESAPALAPAAAPAEPTAPAPPAPTVEDAAAGLDLGGLDIFGEVEETPAAPAAPAEERKSTAGKGEWDDPKTEKLIRLRATEKKLWPDVAKELDEDEMTCVRKYSMLDEDDKKKAGHTYDAAFEWTDEVLKTIAEMKKENEDNQFLSAFFNVPLKELGPKIKEALKAHNGNGKGKKSRQGSEANGKKGAKEQGSAEEKKDDSADKKKSEQDNKKKGQESNKKGGKKKQAEEESDDKKPDGEPAETKPDEKTQDNGGKNKNKPDTSSKQGPRFVRREWDETSTYDPSGPPFPHPPPKAENDPSAPLTDQFNETINDRELDMIARLAHYYDCKKYEDVASRFFDQTGKVLDLEQLRARLATVQFDEWLYG